jgi:hypothetical protein
VVPYSFEKRKSMAVSGLSLELGVHRDLGTLAHGLVVDGSPVWSGRGVVMTSGWLMSITRPRKSCRLPGITPDLARRIAETRESAGSFEPVEDLGISVDLSPSLVDEILEYAVFR